MESGMASSQAERTNSTRCFKIQFILQFQSLHLEVKLTLWRTKTFEAVERKFKDIIGCAKYIFMV
jgi:hypothetical protein